MSKRRKAVITGFDYYARYLSRLMEEYSTRWRLHAVPNSRLGTLQAIIALRKADALVSFGGPGPNVALSEAARACGVPVVVIWAGTDVLTVAQNPFDLAVYRRQSYDNITDGPWLVDELAEIGVTAQYLPVTAVRAVEHVTPFPNAFRVLTYLPEPRRAFYGEERVYSIARSMPDIEFIVIGTGARNPSAPDNVSFRGYVHDVPAQIDAATVLLRLPDHDGKSMLVLETLARARHVIWTHEFPGVHAVQNIAQASTLLCELREKHRLGSLELNYAGRDYVRSEFSPADIAARFEAHLDRIADSRPAERNGRKYQYVAISGLGLFSAEVAEQVERLHPEWKASVLRTNSRIEVFSSLLQLMRADVWYSIGSPVTDRLVDLWARILRKPRVIHWVGSDIEYFRNTASLRKHLRSLAIKHLTEVSWTADELRELGLQSDIVPLPLRHRSSAVKPLPERFTILLYLPKSRPEFYGKRKYEGMLNEFAAEKLRVYVVGGGDLQAPDGTEVINLGWRHDLRAVFEQVTVLIRLTPRDGLSLMVLEALSFSRYVMWSKPFPHCMHVRTRDELISGLRSLLDRHRAGNLQPQFAAAKMIESQYSSERAVEGILQAWESVR